MYVCMYVWEESTLEQYSEDHPRMSLKQILVKNKPSNYNVVKIMLTLKSQVICECMCMYVCMHPSMYVCMYGWMCV